VELNGQLGLSRNARLDLHVHVLGKIRIGCNFAHDGAYVFGRKHVEDDPSRLCVITGPGASVIDKIEYESMTYSTD